jgi:probable phosphomutase (TIGR03848 family)
MPTILLIRHGETDFVGKRLSGHLPGVHLNDKGRRQAEDVAHFLANAPIKAIYSSPLERTRETAQPLAELLNLPVTIHPGLIEINFGTWQGKTTRQMHRLKLWKMVVEKPSEMQFPGGESFSAAQERLSIAIEEIKGSHGKDDLVACFSHSDSIRLLVAHYLNMELDTFQRLSIDTASISVLNLGDGIPHLRHMNLLPSIEWESPKPGITTKPTRVKKTRTVHLAEG